MTIEARVIKIIAENERVHPDTINKTNSFEGDLGMDSLDVIELLMSLEEEFNIDLSEDDVLNDLKTIENVVKYIEDKNNA